MLQNAALTIRSGFPRPDPAVAARFADTPTGFAVDAMGRRGALDPSIRLSAGGSFCGPALTAWTVPGDNLAPYTAIRHAKPGDILVIATNRGREASVIGDGLVGMARNAGIGAIVTDGLIRDIAGIEATGMPVFASGTSPNSPAKNGPGIIGGTLAIGGVAISAGDLILGDRDGVVVVPQALAADVAERLEAIRDKERAMDDAVGAGAKWPAWLEDRLSAEDVVHVD